MKNWHTAIEEIDPYIFKIATPDGYGTGFQVLYPTHSSLVGIATAYHVIDHAEEWQESIKITHHASNQTVFLKDDDRVIFTYPDNDLAFILFGKDKLPLLSQSSPEMIGEKKALKRGVDIGWCGFPHIAPPNEVCFFLGTVSSRSPKEDGYYLVDGVAINGVSGGPAFYIDQKTEKVKICGVISAYKPNRVHGEVYPGLSKICLVEPYQEMLKKRRSLEEAAKKAKEERERLEKEKREKETAETVGKLPIPENEQQKI